MCGIVGAVTAHANGFTGGEAQAFQDLLFMDTLRGFDATGIFYGCTNSAVQIHKEASVGWHFLATDEWKKSKTELIRHGKWIVGHNRAATRGAKTDANAHPFLVEHEERSIILCQNGTYRGDHSKHAKLDVDTEAVAHTIVKEPDLEKALSTINAAYAFVWFDVKENILHLIRNEERPLSLASTKNGTIFFASERDMLLSAIHRNNLAMETPPVHLKAGVHVMYKFKGGTHTIETEELSIDYVPVNFSKVSAPGFVPCLTPSNGSGTSYVSKRDQWLRDREAANQVVNTPGQAMMFLKPSDSPPIKTQEQVDKLVTYAVQERVKQTKFIVEGIDYVPYDEAQDPSKKLSYWAFGKINCINPLDPLDGELVAWSVEGTEKEVLNYITRNMFRATLEYVYRRYYTKKEECLTVIMIKDIETLPLLETEDVIPS